MKFQPKPAWIRVRLPSGPSFQNLTQTLRSRGLHKVCEEARCPNQAECWGAGTATLMLMGDVCTRGCRFCSVQSGRPPIPPDPFEPAKTAETVRLMGLKYVVLTSVNRDDLPDGGADHFARTVETVHAQCPGVRVEALVPDFQGAALERMLASSPEVFAHNVETVERLTPAVRDPRAGYRKSLDVLAEAKRLVPRQLTKSSVMVGLGETLEDLRRTFWDLRDANVDFLTIGQYLKPSGKHLDVVEFLPPERFEDLRREALTFGFAYVASGPLVRSSYKAAECFVESRLEERQKPQEMSGGLQYV